MKNTKLLAATLLSASFALSAQAANWTGGSGVDVNDWTDVDNWGGGDPTTTGIQFNAGANATGSTNDLTTSGQMNFFGGGSATWESSTLTVNDVMQIANGGGSFTVTGGTVNYNNGFKLGNGSDGSTSNYTQTGGTVITNQATFSDSNNSDITNFNISGTASFDAGNSNLNMSKTTGVVNFNATGDSFSFVQNQTKDFANNIGADGTLNMNLTLGAAGFGILEVGDWEAGGIKNLTIVTSAYTGMDTAIKLIDGGSGGAAAFFTGTTTVGSGWAVEFRDANGVDAGDVDVWIVAAVPEPSTFALLAGLLGLSAVMLRRRRA